MNTVKEKISKVVNIVHIGSICLAMALLVGMALIIVVNVFMRYVLDSGIRWAEEVAKLLMVWFTFIGMAVGVKQGLHISLHLLPKKLPPKLEFALTLLKDLVTLVIAVVFFYFGIHLVKFTSSSIMPATEWPGSLLYLILPLAALLIFSEALMDLLRIDDDPQGINQLFSKGEG